LFLGESSLKIFATYYKKVIGHIVEFRLHLKDMDKVADGVGHKLYEEYRSLEAISKTRNLTDDEVAKMLFLDGKQFDLYEATWKLILNK
jgi:hypothetical protein